MVYLVFCVVVIGFVVCDWCDCVIIFGCNGSDYFGVIFVVLFNVDELYIWIDVDGVLLVDLCVVFEVV